jgi:hypothetical protein
MSEKEGNEGGRPTKYKPEYVKQAYKLCLLGATDKELADFFEVHEDTINEWKKIHEDFSVSVREGKKSADMEVVSALFDSTKDRRVAEQQAIKVKKVYWKDGKRHEDEGVEVVEVEKVIPSDFRSQQFWLKNRQPEKWRDKQEIQIGQEANQVFKIGGIEVQF